MRSFLLVLLLVAASACAAAGAGCSPTERTIVTFEQSSSSAGHASSTSSGSSTSGAGGSAASGASSSGSSGAGGASSSTGAGGGCSANDCSDAACIAAGYACAPEVPPGWSGPGFVYSGSATPPSCGSAWTTQTALGGSDISTDAPTCSACVCGAGVDGVCLGTSLVDVFQGAGCSVQASGTQAGVTLCGSTQVPGGLFFEFSARGGPLPATGGSCPASGGAATVTPASFTTQAAMCSAPAASLTGCSAGVCLPTPPAEYGQLCIFQAGDIACPTSEYTTKTVVYQSIKDTRGCTPCACGTPAGGKCPADIEVFDEPNCAGTQVATFPGDGIACSPEELSMSGELSFRFVQTGNAAGATCAASGGAPTGTATGATPMTVCCK